MVDQLSGWRNRIIHGDAVAEMQQMPSDSVDLVVTSPPYNVRNSSGNGMTVGSGKWTRGQMVNEGYDGYGDAMPRRLYVQWQRECLLEMMRLIKAEGAIFYVHRPRVQGGVEETPRDIVDRTHLRQVIIWDKGGGYNHNPGYFTPSYEEIYVITKDPGGQWRRKPGSRNYTNIWRLPRCRSNPHPAPFPVAIPWRAITCTEVAGDGSPVVMDPFMGSGTTAVAALRAGWDYVGFDQSEEYCRRANLRLIRETLRFNGSITLDEQPTAPELVELA